MTRKVPDRRIQRSRKLLQDAMIALVAEKGYEGTTVQDIVERARVGRATFYAHFADKATLFHSRLEDLRSYILARQEVRRSRLGFSLVLLEHVRENIPLWRAIAGRQAGGFALQRIQRLVADLAALDLQTHGFPAGGQHEALAVQYVAGAFMAVLAWWLEHDAVLAPAEVHAIFRRLILHGLG